MNDAGVSEPMARDGTFVVIEGLDAAGKATQTRRLVHRLRDAGEDVHWVEFPAYDTDFGQLVRRYLDGGFGDKDEMPVEVRALLYSLDRYQFKDEFRELLGDGGVLVADRYSQSNYAFQSAEAAADDRAALADWLQAVDSRLPQPDRVIFLDVPPRVALDQLGDDADQHEADRAFQEQVYDRYLALGEREGWTVIDCVDDGAMRSKDTIHQDVWDAVAPLLD